MKLELGLFFIGLIVFIGFFWTFLFSFLDNTHIRSHQTLKGKLLVSHAPYGIYSLCTFLNSQENLYYFTWLTQNTHWFDVRSEPSDGLN